MIMEMVKNSGNLFYYEVLVPVPVKGKFVYSYDEELQIGIRIEVEFGHKLICGIVEKRVKKPEMDIPIKKIKCIYDSKPVFNKEYLELLKGIAFFYNYPVGLVLMGVIAKSILCSEKIIIDKFKTFNEKQVVLNEEQKIIFDKIKKILFNGFSTHLIYGVTGCGKTEIYIELAKKVISAGKQILYIVPEISITSQLINRLNERFGFECFTYHSKISHKRRQKIFWSFVENKIKVLLGARSSLFIPSNNVGLIIVDEEHEFSYKQDEAPGYHLRDMAVLYGKIFSIPVILGSATPSISTYKNAKEGKYYFHKLKYRYGNIKIPKINILDLKKEELIERFLSVTLYDKIYQRIKVKEQVILLLNRKGYAHQLICRKCGETLTCVNCSVSMVYYKSSGFARCSYCGASYKNFICNECGGKDFFDYGVGTERAFEVLNGLFPGNVLKIDTDEITSQKKLNNLFESFNKKEYSILVGTQIIAKGLNFKDVTLVGILNLDNMFSLPDFRSTERAYQLLVQVAGRSGRFYNHGEVYVQTFNPEMPVFEMINENFTVFYENELKKRKEHGFPPYSRLMRIIISGTNLEKVKKISNIIMQNIEQSLDVMGPSPAAVFKIKNFYRFNILVFANKHSVLVKSADKIEKVFKNFKMGNMKIKIDIDPYYFM
jgi:primosomal protein N' (replication factor Y)